MVLSPLITSGRAERVCGNIGTGDGVQRRRKDWAAGRQRIGGGAGRSGDNQAIGSLRERKDFVDIDFELNHMRHFAGVQHHFVDGGADTFLAILLTHLGLQQKAFLGDVVAFQHVGELLQGVVRVKIGEKAEVTAVNADDVNVVTGGVRAAPSILPSPPTTTARSACWPISASVPVFTLLS
ncbi:hypothetical protein KPZU09_75880 [Klebsiella pneumoniae]|uniref:Uncharacterized protein n=1 Tax=Klebsiella pneumoniae TaxID=573 RepID=A0A919M3M4_KLEPN|nr:hypothetical protein KPZU09_75880 [Klebsiella pneumoniae]